MDAPTPVSKIFLYQGVEFVTNNYEAILTHDGVPNEFHLLQDFLNASLIGYALIRPSTIFAKSVLQIWKNATVHSLALHKLPA